MIFEMKWKAEKLAIIFSTPVVDHGYCNFIPLMFLEGPCFSAEGALGLP